jgi:hypothetical protein
MEEAMEKIGDNVPRDYASEILGEEKRKIGEQLERLFLLQNKPIKSEARAEMVRELVRRGYHSGQISEAVNKLVDQELAHISLGVILQQLQESPSASGVEDYCLFCGDKDANGDYIASGYLPALETAEDGSWNEVRIACNCSKGRQVAQESGITVWNGKEQMTSKKKKTTLTVYNKNSDEYPMNMIDEKDRCSRKKQETS